MATTRTLSSTPKVIFHDELIRLRERISILKFAAKGADMRGLEDNLNKIEDAVDDLVGATQMPAKSKAQNRLMQAVAHSPQFAKKVGIPQSVGKEFAAKTESTKGLPQRVRKKR